MISRDPLSVDTSVKVDAESELLFGRIFNFQCFLTVGAPYRWLAVTAVYLVSGLRGLCVYVCVRRGSFTMLWTSHHPPPVRSCGSEPCHLL